MTKERELLRRAVEEWSLDRDLYSFDKIMQEIEDHLAAEEANTIEVPRDIYVHLKKGRVTPFDLIEAVKKAEEGKQDQEPVAWGVMQVNGKRPWFSNESKSVCQGYANNYSHRAATGPSHVVVPLFLHPTPRPFVRLTDEEIKTLEDSGLSPDWTDEFELYHFARAIEGALEEKNNAF